MKKIEQYYKQYDKLEKYVKLFPFLKEIIENHGKDFLENVDFGSLYYESFEKLYFIIRANMTIFFIKDNEIKNIRKAFMEANKFILADEFENILYEEVIDNYDYVVVLSDYLNEYLESTDTFGVDIFI
jgi:hypothetical protein